MSVPAPIDTTACHLLALSHLLGMALPLSYRETSVPLTAYTAYDVV